MKIIKQFSVAAFSGLLAATAAGPAHADQIEQLFKTNQQGCVDSVKINLVDAIRSGIDKEVKRHEAALQKPPSLGQLGCLDNLFNLNLDFAIQVPNLEGLFKQAVSDAENQLCSYAQDAWNKITEPLQSALQLPSFDGIKLPGGMDGGSGPNLNFDYNDRSLNFDQPNVGESGRRENDGAIMNELYKNLYGPGGHL